MNTLLDNMHLLVLHIGRKHCGPDWNYRDVCSPFMRIYYILSGRAQISLSDRQLALEPGRMYCIPAFTPHSCSCSNEFEHYYVHLYNEAQAHFLEDWNLPPEIDASTFDLQLIERLTLLCTGMELAQIDPQAYDNNSSLAERILINKQRPLWARIESRGLIYTLLSKFLRQASPKTYVSDPRIKAVLDYIRANLTEPIDLEQLARLAHLSKDHLIRTFRKELAATPLAYINTKRIEQAQAKLITEQAPIKQIAYELGFDDQAYFNRLFKKLTGTTPKAYRQAATKQ